MRSAAGRDDGHRPFHLADEQMPRLRPVAALPEFPHRGAEMHTSSVRPSGQIVSGSEDARPLSTYHRRSTTPRNRGPGRR